MRLCLILRDRKVGANENRHEDGGRLSRDRWFESGSLQRRVRCEPASVQQNSGQSQRFGTRAPRRCR
jgi:hypothetical protein